MTTKSNTAAAVPPAPAPKPLPVTYHLTIVRVPEKGERMHSVVISEMRGNEVLRRKVLATEMGVDPALDELNRVAMRVFYFGEGPDQF